MKSKNYILILSLFFFIAALIGWGFKSENKKIINTGIPSKTNQQVAFENLFSIQFPTYWRITISNNKHLPHQLFYLVKIDPNTPHTDFLLDSNSSRITLDLVPKNKLDHYILKKSMLNDKNDPDPIISLRETKFLLTSKNGTIQTFTLSSAKGYKIFFPYTDSLYLVFTATFGTWDPLEDLKYIIESLEKL